MAIGSGVLLPGVAENPTFPILSALAYTTGLGYRPTCDMRAASYKHFLLSVVWKSVCVTASLSLNILEIKGDSRLLPIRSL